MSLVRAGRPLLVQRGLPGRLARRKRFVVALMSEEDGDSRKRHESDDADKFGHTSDRSRTAPPARYRRGVASKKEVPMMATIVATVLVAICSAISLLSERAPRSRGSRT